MSIDKSLRSKSTLVRHRNVLTRAERIAVLTDVGRFEEDSSPLKLPKVAHRKAAVGKKTKKKAAEEPTAKPA
jgi:small basic protein (TIGR04137 family)